MRHALLVDHTTLIAEVQNMLHTKTGIPPDRQNLIYAGKQLQCLADQKLCDMNIQKEATLDLIIRGDIPEPIPDETTFSQREAVNTTISAWEAQAKAGDFDDDLYIVDPKAYHSKLAYLEEDVIKASEFFRTKGDYEPSNDQGLYSDVRSRTRLDPGLVQKLNELLLSSPNQTSESPLDPNQTHWQEFQKPLASLWKSYLILTRIWANLVDMQMAKFCGEFFSVLVERPHNELAEIVRISICHVDYIRTRLESVLARILETLEVKAIKWYLGVSVAVPCGWILELLGYRCTIPQTPSISSSLMLCRMVALLLDLALVSYMGSHGRRFDIDYIGKDCRNIKVQCPLEEAFSFSLRLRTLSCLDEFLDNRMAWTLRIYPPRQSMYQEEQRRSTKPLSILTHMADFCDIWGPISTIRVRNGTTKNIKQYNVSKGVICRVREEPLPYRNSIKCHWFSWPGYRRRQLSSLISRPKDLYLSDDDLLLIGAVDRENPHCTYTLDDFELDYENCLGVLGTRPSEWKLDSVGASLGLSKIVGITLSGTKKRIPETPLKQLIYDRWSARKDSFRANPAVLNQFLGIEVSICTGNARRISMKELLLMESLEPLLKRQIPHWKETKWGVRFKEALRRDESQAIFDFWDKFKPERKYVAELFCSVLEALDTTGCRDNTFVAGLFNNGQDFSVNLSLKKNNWACFLKDSPLMAVYAVMNRVCLECQMPNHITATHGNSESYTVLKTQIALEVGTNFERIKLDPYGLTFKRVDGGDPATTVLVPESGFEKLLSFMTTLKHPLVTAVEVWNHRPYMNISKRRVQPRITVYICASNKSYGGMDNLRTYTAPVSNYDQSDHVLAINGRTPYPIQLTSVCNVSRDNKTSIKMQSNPNFQWHICGDHVAAEHHMCSPSEPNAGPLRQPDTENPIPSTKLESDLVFPSSEPSSVDQSNANNERHENLHYRGQRSLHSSTTLYSQSSMGQVSSQTPNSISSSILDDPRKYEMYSDDDMEVAALASIESARGAMIGSKSKEGDSRGSSAIERHGSNRIRRQPRFMRDNNAL